jgi:hypothetical protein
VQKQSNPDQNEINDINNRITEIQNRMKEQVFKPVRDSLTQIGGYKNDNSTPKNPNFYSFDNPSNSSLSDLLNSLATHFNNLNSEYYIVYKSLSEQVHGIAAYENMLYNSSINLPLLSETEKDELIKKQSIKIENDKKLYLNFVIIIGDLWKSKVEKLIDSL